VWGAEGHAVLARLRIGIVGLGSVGMAVAENLARTGVERFSLIEFDEVQLHNLDRLQGANCTTDVGRPKIDVAKELIERSATARDVEVRRVPFSVVEPQGYDAALDCDVIFSCVDRPRARQLLNHVAYAHLIPVIDGGIAVLFRTLPGSAPVFRGAAWQAQTVGPGKPCLECLEAFDSSDVDTERQGLLEDPRYMQGLAEDHSLKRNENVYPFSANLASIEVMHLVALAAGLPQLDSFGKQRVQFVAGIMESDRSISCRPMCDISELVATGDRAFKLTGKDHAADGARQRQR
jgi:molybdopterin/thiamine biosynthesis adenylyltransferase